LVAAVHHLSRRTAFTADAELYRWQARFQPTTMKLSSFIAFLAVLREARQSLRRGSQASRLQARRCRVVTMLFEVGLYDLTRRGLVALEDKFGAAVHRIQLELTRVQIY
jgi:hypothetical protein